MTKPISVELIEQGVEDILRQDESVPRSTPMSHQLYDEFRDFLESQREGHRLRKVLYNAALTECTISNSRRVCVRGTRGCKSSHDG